MYLIDFDHKIPYHSMLCIFIVVLKTAIYNFLKQISFDKQGIQI